MGYTILWNLTMHEEFGDTTGWPCMGHSGANVCLSQCTILSIPEDLQMHVLKTLNSMSSNTHLFLMALQLRDVSNDLRNGN